MSEEEFQHEEELKEILSQIPRLVNTGHYSVIREKLKIAKDISEGSKWEDEIDEIYDLIKHEPVELAPGQEISNRTGKIWKELRD